MKKKILATALAAMMLTVCCMGASAAPSTRFGGPTSGGTKGAMNMDCYFTIDSAYAYDIAVGYVTGGSTDYTIFVRGNLVGAVNGQGFNVNLTHDSIWDTSGTYNNIVAGDRMVLGHSNMYPPSGINGYSYTKASVEIGYQSGDYGMWHYGKTMWY